MLSSFKIWWDDFQNLLYPAQCLGCGKKLQPSHKHLCIPCCFKLHQSEIPWQANLKVDQVFWGRVLVEQAASVYYFEKGGVVQQMIHALKYQHNRSAGIWLGKQMGRYIIQNSIQYSALVPLPLHPKKEAKRGYNQSLLLAKGIQEITGSAIVNDLVVRALYQESQTHKNRLERWKNVKDVFELSTQQPLTGQHLLLIDDVVTTGATAEACLACLAKIPGVALSFLSLAYAPAI